MMTLVVVVVSGKEEEEEEEDRVRREKIPCERSSHVLYVQKGGNIAPRVT